MKNPSKYRRLTSLLYSYETAPEKVREYLTENFQNETVDIHSASLKTMNDIIAGKKVSSAQVDDLIIELNLEAELKEGQGFMKAAAFIIYGLAFIAGIVVLMGTAGFASTVLVWGIGFAVGSLLLGLAVIISLLSRMNLELIRSNRNR